jgi:hypothetical protein
MPTKVIASFTTKEPFIKKKVGRFLFVEVWIRIWGEKWEIHKNDPDYFPSDPHAHNVQRGWKMDLSSGRIYDKRKEVDKLSKKDLQRFRSRPELKDIELPALNLN